MKDKKLIFVILVSLIITTGLICYNVKNSSAEVESNKEKMMEIYNVKNKIKVNFYHWDRKANKRKEFIGTAELKDGKLTYDVTDRRLEKMLKWDFHTMITVEKDSKLVNKSVTYKVGTIKHLMSVIDHCKDIGCIAEIKEE